jgi:prepilin-type N-terminal cleavage/methylation domain-containing protein
MKRSRSQSGFTLVEVAAVAAVAGIALAAAAGAVSQGAQIARSAAETRAAMDASETMIEQVRATAFSTLETTYDGVTKTLASLGDTDVEGTCTVDVSPVDTGSSSWKVYAVTTTVSWSGSTGEQEMSFVTYVSDRTVGSSLAGADVYMADSEYTEMVDGTADQVGDTLGDIGSTFSGSTSDTSNGTGSSSTTTVTADSLRTRKTK